MFFTKWSPNSTLRVIPPRNQWERLFNEAHAEVFGARFSDLKVHSELRRHYWWSGMRRNITQWICGCLVCNSHSLGRAVHASLTPVPVNGPFDWVGVDVIQFPRSHLGNQYVVVFMDYLTKWPEVYPTPDQSAATIANLLVREIVSHHGVPSELLSDLGQAFLSGLLKKVQQFLGYNKLNTSAYHPKTDGLVECLDSSGLSVNTMDTDQEAVLLQQDDDGESSSHTSKMKKRSGPRKQDWPKQSASKCSEKTPFSGGPTGATNVAVTDQDFTQLAAEPVETKGGKWAHCLRKNPKKYSPEEG